MRGFARAALAVGLSHASTVRSAGGTEQAARACDPSPGTGSYSARSPHGIRTLFPPNRRGCQDITFKPPYPSRWRLLFFPDASLIPPPQNWQPITKLWRLQTSARPRQPLSIPEFLDLTIFQMSPDASYGGWPARLLPHLNRAGIPHSHLPKIFRHRPPVASDHKTLAASNKRKPPAAGKSVLT